MRVRIISEIQEFLDYKDKWNAIFNKHDYSFFQSFEFNYYSWINELSKNKLNRLCIISLKNNGLVFAILPLYIDSKRRLRFINDVHADFCDVLSEQKFEFETILSEIRDKFKFHSVHFINCKKDSFLYKLFIANQLKNSLLMPHAKYSDIAISAGNFPSNMIRYKSKQKTEFRRVKKKNLGKDHYILQKYDDSDFPINEIYKLRERIIKLRLRKDNFLDEDRLLLLEKLYNSNRILISLVKTKGNTHAISFISRNKNNYLFWIDMYDNSKMINIYNYISFIENVSLNDRVNINFGRGVYDYKLQNFKPDIKQLFSIHIFQNKFKLNLFLVIERIINFLKLIYKIFLK